jgi:hypothetical protein
MPRSRKSMTFISFINERQRDNYHFSAHSHEFEYWDDYAMWLYYTKAKENAWKYYGLLEEDIKAYSDMQTGKEQDTIREKYKKQSKQNI